MANLRVRELTEKRSLNSKHYLRDDGKYEAEIYQRPVHYLDDQGDLQNIVTDWKTEVGFGQKVKKAKHHLRIFDGKLRFGFAPQVYVDYDLPGQLATAGNIAELVDAWTNTDMRYTSTNTGVKGDIILKAPGHPGSFSFAVTAANCEPVQEGNALAFYRDGEIIGKIPVPYAIDAENNIGPVTLTYDGISVTFTPNTDWMATAVYPVIIDPTTIQPDGTDGKDSYVDEGNPTVNYGTQVAMVAGTDANPHKSRGMVQFDLSPITGPISSAILSLYCNAETSSANYNVSAHQITATWDEAAVTWNTQPAHDASAEDTVSITGTAVTFDWNMSTRTEEWRSGAANNYGVKLLGDETTTNTEKAFNSSDYGTASLRPKLVVTYTPVAPTILAPASTDSTNPTQYTDEITPQSQWSTTYTQAAYQVQILDSSDSVIVDSGEVAGAGTIYSPGATDGLVYGETYQIKVRGKDNNAVWSSYGSGHYLQCVYSAPANLTATADANNAEMDLNWNDHAGENLAGYRVYRKLSAGGTWAQINTGLETSSAYSDELAASGSEYDYAVTAVAIDGYESAKSLTATGTVTFTGFWINDSSINLKYPFEPSYPRRASSRVATDNSYITQDLGTLPRTGSITIQFESLSERDTLIALFPQGQEFTYRDEQGETFRGKVVSTISTSRFRIPSSRGFYGTIAFEAVEVTA